MSLAASDVLSHPALYLLYQSLVGGIRARRITVRDHVRPGPGLKVLDIGCGPAYTTAYFPSPEYYGFDVSPAYVKFANTKFSAHGRFFCQLFDRAALEWLPRMDVALMLGLLHHLDDTASVELLTLTKAAMKPGARLFTLDGFYEPGQPRIARFLLDQDRGKFIRKQDEYVTLAAQVFGEVKRTVRNDLFYVPYPSLILECRP
jgi:SAM-dependent methyltransferase